MSDIEYNTKEIKEQAEKYGITMPNIRLVKSVKYYDYENFVDFEEMEAVNKALSHAKRGLFEATHHLNKVDNILSSANTLYQRKWRREYIGSLLKTDAAKKTDADIKCEELEDNVIVYKQAKEELKQICYVLKIELQTLQTIASNKRQQLNIQ